MEWMAVGVERNGLPFDADELLRRILGQAPSAQWVADSSCFDGKLERETGIEPAASSLAKAEPAVNTKSST